MGWVIKGWGGVGHVGVGWQWGGVGHAGVGWSYVMHGVGSVM